MWGHHKSYLFRDYDTALPLFDRSLAASPGSAIVWALSSPTFSYIGQSAEAIARATRAIRLSPLDAHAFWYQTTLTLAHYAAGNYEKAVEFGRKVFGSKPNFTANMRFLAASLAALGEFAEANRVASLLLQVEPGFRTLAFIKSYSFRDRERLELFAHHLRTAGLPE
jgi:adenylate cyclase